MIDVEHLRHDLPRRRWFGGKGRDIASVEVLDSVTISDGPPALVMALASVDFADGLRHMYHLVLLVDPDGSCRDAMDDLEPLRVVGELMTQGETIKGNHGRFHFGGPGLDPRSPPGERSIRAIGVEQSNSSVVLDEDVVLKLFRRVEPGPNPDVELNRLLTADGFEHIPAQVGEINYEGPLSESADEIEIDLGIAQQLIQDARGGWEETLDRLSELLRSADASADLEAAVEERAGASLDELAKLGDVTASLHVLLAREELDPDVFPEPATAQDVSGWVSDAEAWLERLLDRGIPQIEEHVESIRERLDEVAELQDAGRKTRVHGDYHLGQVLLAPRGWMILDFEGEPLRSLEERRAKTSPLRDVAGMLRSFGYASFVSLRAEAQPGSERWMELEPWSRAWESLARDRFLSAYLRTSHEGGFLPSDRPNQLELLDLFELQKALYELDYELGHRPDWAGIPLHGILTVLERGERR